MISYITLRNHALGVGLQAMIGCGFDPAQDGPPAGNPEGSCLVPAEAAAEDTSKPDRVIGNGTKESCTSEAVIIAVAAGGVITFNCGPDPVTIVLRQTAEVLNSGPRVVLDGGGKVALSGGGSVRILRMNTCDTMQGWPASVCQSLGGPALTVQNLTFVDGATNGADVDGGGAILAIGGVLKVVNCRFFRNSCVDGGWMGGGGAIRIRSQDPSTLSYVVHSTFGGSPGLGNFSINGGALAAVHASYLVLNSSFTYNQAIGVPRIGSGGAIYSFGDNKLNLCGVELSHNFAIGAGGGIWFGGHTIFAKDILGLSSSSLHGNRNDSETSGYPGIFVERGRLDVQNTTID
jgi:hypothetical protein